ncbi:MAG: hypothetical protein SP1CHLAM54_07400 [Chlamydiia bacterium]|nr:hypothetical protein [Chlamydiia bacterium]MCH9615646.1 hypothetical protein [Chlamydiia bacterium]MCH9628951.1 hypothetical protein [Chlamydiia bacterium]
MQAGLVQAYSQRLALLTQPATAALAQGFRQGQTMDHPDPYLDHPDPYLDPLDLHPDCLPEVCKVLMRRQDQEIFHHLHPINGQVALKPYEGGSDNHFQAAAHGAVVLQPSVSDAVVGINAQLDDDRHLSKAASVFRHLQLEKGVWCILKVWQRNIQLQPPP